MHRQILKLPISVYFIRKGCKCWMVLLDGNINVSIVTSNINNDMTRTCYLIVYGFNSKHNCLQHESLLATPLYGRLHYWSNVCKQPNIKNPFHWPKGTEMYIFIYMTGLFRMLNNLHLIHSWAEQRCELVAHKEIIFSINKSLNENKK